MVTGFNTNVTYKAKVFHVQTEDCPRKSRIQTVVFEAGTIVAAINCPYSDLTGAGSPQGQNLSRRLESQHWELVKRLKESGSTTEVVPEVKVARTVQAGLDQCIELAQPAPQTLVALDETLDASTTPPAAVEPSRSRRGFNPWSHVGAVVLLGVGWSAHWLVNQANETNEAGEVSAPAVVENLSTEAKPVAKPVVPERKAQPTRGTQPATTSVSRPDAGSPEASAAGLPDRTPAAALSTGSAAEAATPSNSSLNTLLTTPSVTASNTASDTASDTASTMASVDAPAELPPASPVNDHADSAEALPDPSPTIDAPELPVDPAPAIVTPSPTPKVDWTGKLVPLNEVDTTPATIKRDLPRYTKRAKRKKQQGSVGLKLLIDETGAVSRVDLLESIPDSDLNEATIDLARLWRYRPATKEGYPVRVWKPLTIEFSIVSGSARVVVKDTGGL